MMPIREHTPGSQKKGSSALLCAKPCVHCVPYLCEQQHVNNEPHSQFRDSFSVLNQTAAWWFENTTHIVANAVLSVPDPNVTIMKKCKVFPVEFVCRGFMTGGGWRRFKERDKRKSAQRRRARRAWHVS
eukprot:scaffold235775_cov18-Tisochrysis_lutea.AAC.1